MADEVDGNRAALTGEHAQHLSRVLRAHVGQRFDIATGTAVRAGHVTAVSESRVEFELGEAVTDCAFPLITLALAIFKFDRMEWAIEKSTELGVARIIPVIAQRTETHLAATVAKRVGRWRRIALQASEQSRRASQPEIAQPARLEAILALPAASRVVLLESEHTIMLADALDPSARDVILAIGPEGGWTDAEVDRFRIAQWTFASLGNTILRSETAAIAAVAILLSELQ